MGRREGISVGGRRCGQDKTSREKVRYKMREKREFMRLEAGASKTR